MNTGMIEITEVIRSLHLGWLNQDDSWSEFRSKRVNTLSALSSWSFSSVSSWEPDFSRASTRKASMAPEGIEGGEKEGISVLAVK